MKIKFIALVASLLAFAGCGVTTSLTYYDAAPQLIRSEFDGTYVIRACGIDKDAVSAMIEAQKVAVYEVIFNGVVSTSSTTSSLKPLVMEVNAKEKYQDYFNLFFGKGEYRKYCATGDRRSGSSTYQRSNQEVKCFTNVTVNVAALKEKLKQDNIIK